MLLVIPRSRFEAVILSNACNDKKWKPDAMETRRNGNPTQWKPDA